MKRRFTLQRVVVSRFSISSLLIFLFLLVALCGPMLRVAHLKTPQKENVDAARLAQRIERVENGLLPPAVLKGEPPAKMRLADRMQF